MKCQRCIKQATLHITEVLGEAQYEELHLCEECAQKYLYEPAQQQKKAGKGDGAGEESSDEAGLLNDRKCDVCGVKFVSASEATLFGDITT